MLSLFPDIPALPDGFSYVPDYLTIDEEDQLIGVIENMELKNMMFQGFEAKRKTASFGFDWSFEKRVLSRGKDIPSEFTALVQKVAGLLGIDAAAVGELLVTEYPPGSVINWHRDAPPFDVIVGISLLSDCSFRFRPHEKALQNRQSIISLPVRRRSMYIMRGESRSKWQHSIAPVSQQRYSITMRTLR